MAEASIAPFLFSPSFLKYFDFDITNQQYVIRDSITSQIISRIQKGFINPAEEEPIEVAKRFKWQNENSIKLKNVLLCRSIQFGANNEINLEEKKKVKYVLRPQK